jgi:hypothetical protein
VLRLFQESPLLQAWWAVSCSGDAEGKEGEWVEEEEKKRRK